MNGTHIHLLITHLPIFGSILGALVLIYGLLKRNDQVSIAAYGLFIISAIGAGIAYFTGEDAEETAEDIQGVLKSSIEEHQDFAKIALIALIVLGIASIAGIFITLKRSRYSRRTGIVILLISLISFGLVAKTGSLGGNIRHTEINKDASQETGQHDHDEDHDD